MMSIVVEDPVTHHDIEVKYGANSSKNIRISPEFIQAMGGNEGYEYECEPYSGKADNPEARYTKKIDILTNVLPHLIPALNAEGETIDVFEGV